MSLRQPPLRDRHEAAGAQFTDFGGWEMPVEFDSVRTEHEAVRESAGIFDVSHMGEIEVSGPGAPELMDRLLTDSVADLDRGRATYCAITDEDGVMLDDTVVYRRPSGEFLFVPNAGHDAETDERWVDHRDRWDLMATVENRTEDYAMFAVQGPDAVELVAEAADAPDLAELSRFGATDETVAGVECQVSRTGYTGEDGFELILPWDGAGAVWDAIDCQPCGLGARDTLRLEAGLLLSGQDFHPGDNPRTPYEADIGWSVDLDHEFVGRDALRAVDEAGPDERIVGLRPEERGIPRSGYTITTEEGEEIGEVTSGTMSPTLGHPIAMGYVPVEYAEEGTDVRVVIRGDPKKATVVDKRFLDE
ncbi:glycine cleavage system protein T [Halobacteriales archaeon QS_8_69_26]|nr:MAG: glycine cleavage system protein T [Halobacteriales archaeon QS_8_69_26]